MEMLALVLSVVGAALFLGTGFFFGSARRQPALLQPAAAAEPVPAREDQSAQLKQAAERERKLAQEVAAAQRQLAGAREAAKKAQEAHKTFGQERTQLLQRGQALETQVSKLRQEGAELRQAAEQAADELEQLQGDSEKTQPDSKVMQSEMRARQLAQELADARRQLSDSRAAAKQAGALETRVAGLNEQLKRLENQRAADRRERAGLSDRLKKAQVELEQRQRHIDSLVPQTEKKTGLHPTAPALAKTTEALAARDKQLKASAERLEQAKKAAQQQQASLNKQLAGVQKQLADVQKQLTASHKKAAGSLEEVGLLKAKLAAASKARDEAASAAPDASLRGRIAQLEQRVSEGLVVTAELVPEEEQRLRQTIAEQTSELLELRVIAERAADLERQLGLQRSEHGAPEVARVVAGGSGGDKLARDAEKVLAQLRQHKGLHAAVVTDQRALPVATAANEIEQQPLVAATASLVEVAETVSKLVPLGPVRRIVVSDEQDSALCAYFSPGKSSAGLVLSSLVKEFSQGDRSELEQAMTSLSTLTTNRN